MFSHALKLFTAACFLLIISPVLSIETVSITSIFPNSQHSCVTRCIYTSYFSDIGNALHCGSPYANDCFCNTAPASASAATSWLAACGSSSCAGGDLSDDLASMHSIYASYCIGAGFTQPGATDWYNPASATANPGPSTKPSTTANPGQTVSSGPGQTTTQITVVTQTAPSISGSVATQPQVVTVHTTSTLLIGSNGSPIPTSSDSGPNKLALGVGLGVGIFAVLVVAAVGLCLCLRRRRSSRRAEAYQPPPMQQQQEAVPEPVLPFAAAMGPSSIPRKSVPVHRLSTLSQTTELTGEGVRRELSGREANQFPSPMSPGSLASMPGEYEMSGDGQARELPVQSRSPPPQYTHAVVRQPELGTQAQGQVGDRRWELP